MSKDMIDAEIALLETTERVVTAAKNLGYTREQTWEHLAFAVGNQPRTLAIRRVQFDLVWPVTECE